MVVSQSGLRDCGQVAFIGKKMIGGPVVRFEWPLNNGAGHWCEKRPGEESLGLFVFREAETKSAVFGTVKA